MWIFCFYLWAVCWLDLVESCEQTVLEYGYMEGDIVGEITTDSACTCCTYCHEVEECVSFSYFGTQSLCRLYSVVAGYNTLMENNTAEYHVMAWRRGSERHSFCQDDSNCRRSEDRCRARICTDQKTIVCRDLMSQYARTQSGVYWVSVDGVTEQIFCRFTETNPVQVQAAGHFNDQSSDDNNPKNDDNTPKNDVNTPTTSTETRNNDADSLAKFTETPHDDANTSTTSTGTSKGDIATLSVVLVNPAAGYEALNVDVVADHTGDHDQNEVAINKQNSNIETTTENRYWRIDAEKQD